MECSDSAKIPVELDMAMEWKLEHCNNKLKLTDIEAGKILLYFSRITIDYCYNH